MLKREGWPGRQLSKRSVSTSLLMPAFCEQNLSCSSSFAPGSSSTAGWDVALKPVVERLSSFTSASLQASSLVLRTSSVEQSVRPGSATPAKTGCGGSGRTWMPCLSFSAASRLSRTCCSAPAREPRRLPT